jgi:hypothetical protein
MKNQLDEAVHEAMASHEIPDELVLAFAPLHKRAFGMALGAAFGGMLFLVTVVALVVPGPRPNLALLAQYFAGYSVSWPRGVRRSRLGRVRGIRHGMVHGVQPQLRDGGADLVRPGEAGAGRDAGLSGPHLTSHL